MGKIQALCHAYETSDQRELLRPLYHKTLQKVSEDLFVESTKKGRMPVVMIGETRIRLG